MKKYLFSALAAAAMCFATSCDDNPGVNTYSIQGAYTIEGSGMTGYTCYADFGGIVKTAPTTTDFGKNKRAILGFNFTQENIRDTGNGNIIENATIIGAQLIPVLNIMDKEEAELKNVCVADSSFEINSIKDLWGYRGYLTAVINGNFSANGDKGIYPSLTIVAELDSIANTPNELHLKGYYNRHTAKNVSAAGTQDFIWSFPISTVANHVTGSDSITIFLDVPGHAKRCKISRADIYPSQYHGFGGK